jgi:hypothetical protein
MLEEVSTKQRAYKLVRRGARILHLEPFVVAYGEARLPYAEWRDRQARRNMRLLMRVLLDAESNCVDIGANRGAVLRDMVAVESRGHHYAFEPVAGRARSLKASFPGVDVRGVALSHHAGDATFVRGCSTTTPTAA